MYKQLIFCLETNRRAATDWIYISEAINHYYEISNALKLSQVFMDSKSRYNSKDVIKDINKKIKDYKLGESIVIYCIDVDDFETNQNHVREYAEISEYCSLNNYELIWFCHDIEDVFLGKRISKEKTKAAASFRTRDDITGVNKEMLRSEDCHKIHSSNLIKVLDKYLV